MLSFKVQKFTMNTCKASSIKNLDLKKEISERKMHPILDTRVGLNEETKK